MNIDKFTRAISLVVELQNMADHEIHFQKNSKEKGPEEALEMASKLSCRISDVYDDLLEYVGLERLR